MFPFLPELNVPSAVTGPLTWVLFEALGLAPPLLTQTSVAVASAFATKWTSSLVPSPASWKDTTRFVPLTLALAPTKCGLSANAGDAAMMNPTSIIGSVKMKSMRRRMLDHSLRISGVWYRWPLSDLDVERGRDRVRRGVECVAELVRDLSVGVAHRVQEPELPGGTGEAARAERARDRGAGGLAVADREVGRAGHPGRPERLGYALGLVAGLVVALVGGGRIGGERDMDARGAGAQPRLLEHGVQRAGAGVDAVGGE